MDMWKSQYLGKWICHDQEYAAKKYLDLYGAPVKRNPIDYPYSYDEYVLYKAKGFNELRVHGMYSDRMLSWNRNGFDEACQKVWGNHAQSFANRKPEDVERFLCLYLDKPVKLMAILQGCNASNGFPYWAFLFEGG